jgi:hypothetical protein
MASKALLCRKANLKICYTSYMQTRDYWPRWAESLRLYKLDALAASLLEAGGPLNLLGAQILYFGVPFLGESADALACTLESVDEARAFASYLDPAEHGAGGGAAS